MKYFILFLLVITASILVNSFAIMCGWNWFLVEINPVFTHITFTDAVIINAAKSLIFFTYSKSKSQSIKETFTDSVSFLIQPLIAIAIMFILKLIIL